MAFVDVIKCCLDSLRHISEDINGSFIYLDAGCTESFQFMGSFPLLLELGALAVHSLENMTPLDTVVDWNSNNDGTRKIVIFTSRLLSDAHRYVLRCLSTHQGVSLCSIFTSISEMSHSAYPDSPLGPDAYREYKSLLVQDYEEIIRRNQKNSSFSVDISSMENLKDEVEGWPQLTSSGEGIYSINSIDSPTDIYKRDSLGLVDLRGNLTVSVHHFPLILCPFSPRVFVLPSEGSVAEAYLSAQHETSISPGLPPLGSGASADGDDISPGAMLTAQFLYHMAAKMDLKLEIFSLGDISKTVGKLLTDMSSLYDVGRRKKSAGLLLIDRTLDLLTPCFHGDSLVDRIFSCLRRREPICSTYTKGSYTQLTQSPIKLKRAPIDVQIPLDHVLGSENPTSENFRFPESVEAFLHGWSSNGSASQTVDLIDLRSIVSAGKAIYYKSEILNGSLVSSETFRGTPYLEALLDRRTKDGAILIKKWLQESMRKENIPLDIKIRPAFVSKTELKPMIKALARTQSSLMRNKGIIQLASAALYALDELHSARWDAFTSAEKILTISAGDTSQSLAAQISDIVNKSALVKSHGHSEGLLTFQDAMLLTIVGYILAGENFPTSGAGGPFSWQEEHFLKEAIVDVILENPAVTRLKFLQDLMKDLEANSNRNKMELKEPCPNDLQSDDFDDGQWGSWGDEDTDENENKEQAYDDMQLKLELQDRVDNFFRSLHKLSKLRRSILSKEAMLVLGSNYNDESYSNKGLLYKLLTRVLGKHDVPGLQYHSSTVGRFLKSGFGRFGLVQANPSLADQSTILIFVIGGINGVEVREAQEALSESGRPDVEMILGGTTFLTPNDMFDLILGDHSYVGA